MGTLFISHSSTDDAFVRRLREVLADQGQDSWIDSRELCGGDPLWPEIQKAIEAASAFAVVVSPQSLQADWVSDELDHAVKVPRPAWQGGLSRHSADVERYDAWGVREALRWRTDQHRRQQRRRRPSAVAGLTGVQARHYDGHDYMPEKRLALDILSHQLLLEADA